MERRHSERDPDQDPVRQSLEKLKRAVAEIQDSETFRRYLDVQSRFHNVSSQ